MIAPQELRIGNLLNAVVSNGVETLNFHEIKVKEIRTDGIKEEKGVKFPYDILKPIELTEEWLIRMGFTISGGWIYKFGVTESDVNDGVHYVLESNTIVIGSHNKLKYKIKYVHQLQNLFYSLCGEELQLKY